MSLALRGALAGLSGLGRTSLALPLLALSFLALLVRLGGCLLLALLSLSLLGLGLSRSVLALGLGLGAQLQGALALVGRGLALVSVVAKRRVAENRRRGAANGSVGTVDDQPERCGCAILGDDVEDLVGREARDSERAIYCLAWNGLGHEFSFGSVASAWASAARASCSSCVA